MCGLPSETALIRLILYTLITFFRQLTCVCPLRSTGDLLGLDGLDCGGDIGCKEAVLLPVGLAVEGTLYDAAAG